MRTVLPLHHSLLSFSDPPPDLADDTTSPSLPLPSGQFGSRYEGVAFPLKPKVSVGLLVFVSPRFLSLCLGSTFRRRLLLPSQKGLVFAVVLPLLSLICSSLPPPPPTLPTVAFNFLTLSVNGIRDPIKRAGLLQ